MRLLATTSSDQNVRLKNDISNLHFQQSPSYIQLKEAKKYQSKHSASERFLFTVIRFPRHPVHPAY